MVRKMRISNKGITLIALVVTIVVLIILAGITIASLTGEKGIIKEARTAKELSEKAALEELVDLAIIKAEEKYKNPTIDNVIEEIKNKKVVSNEEQVDKETGAITTDAGYLIEGKLDDYLGKTSTGGDEGGNNTGGGDNSGNEGEDKPSQLPGSIDELKAGTYINYIDKSNTTRKCVVLYDSTSSYGVQIVTTDTVEEITLGVDGNINTSITSYNGAISTLNSKANNYLNTTYASAARSIGSVPNRPSSEATTYFTSSYSYMSSYNNRCKNEDTNYETDYEQMEKLGINTITNKIYWLASRSISSGSAFTSFDINLGGNGKVSSCNCGIINASGHIAANSNSFGLRPVFTLKPEVKITGGAGTETEPYTLGV